MTTTKRQPNAATISSLLKKAGHKKAGPYQTFGSRTSGFIVANPYGTSVQVLHTGAYNRNSEAAKSSERLCEIAVTLGDAGYNVRCDTNREGLTRSLWVERWED